MPLQTDDVVDLDDLASSNEDGPDCQKRVDDWFKARDKKEEKKEKGELS